jgi:hypothetical protein
MLYTTADFTGQYRLDSNAITQADYQSAIDEHERTLLEYFFEPASVEKIYAALPSAAPAVGVRNVMRDLALPFIFARLKMGVGSSVAGEPNTQGYTRIGYTPYLAWRGSETLRRLMRFAPFVVTAELAAPTDTIPYLNPIPQAPDFVAAGDPAIAYTAAGEMQTTVVSITAAAITLASILPAGPVRLIVENLRLRITQVYLTF